MYRSFIHLASAALMIISLAACTDHRDLLAPAKPNAMSTGGGIGGGGVPPIPRATDLMEISAGGYHTCVRRRSGQILCWGLNTSSQIGVPTSAYCAGLTIYLPGTTPCVTIATAVPLLTQAGTGAAVGAAHVTLGNAHTCALDTLKTAWCWGDNSSGQVGRGPTLITQYPLPVTGVNNNLTFVSLGAGGDATCGSSSIGGGLMCWGRFPGSVATQSRPLFVAAGTFSTVVVTGDHGCVNGFTNGQWDCWGSNSSGQLGTSPATLSSTAPFFTVHAMDNAPAIALANGITCNDEPSPGSSQCFGTNMLNSTTGLLGNPQDLAAFDFVPQIAGPFHGVSIGANHGCALDAANAAWCWGIGAKGQLGSGAFQSSTAPVAVQGGLTFRSLAVGIDFSCGIAIDNHVYCWGDNYYGQLGNGGWSFAGIATPVRVSGL